MKTFSGKTMKRGVQQYAANSMVDIRGLGEYMIYR